MFAWGVVTPATDAETIEILREWFQWKKDEKAAKKAKREAYAQRPFFSNDWSLK